MAGAFAVFHALRVAWVAAYADVDAAEGEMELPFGCEGVDVKSVSCEPCREDLCTA